MSTETLGRPLGPLEKRRAPRVAMPRTGGAVSVVGARLVNVSSYGMLIESPVALELEARLALRLIVEGKKADIEARVAACTPLAGGRKRFGVGLEFTRIPEEIQARLQEVLARAVSRAPGPA